MQFCLLYIDKDTARLSTFETLSSARIEITQAKQSLKLVWTDFSKSTEIQEEDQEELEQVINSNFILELLDRNSHRIENPLIVCLGTQLAETYNLHFPFSDRKKVRQVINLELEDLLPFEPDFATNFISTQIFENKSTSGCIARAMLFDRTMFQRMIVDIQLTGLIAPLFIYQPIVTEKLLSYYENSSLFLNYNNSDSYIVFTDQENITIDFKALVLPSEKVALKEILHAHINLLESPTFNQIIVNNNTDIDISGVLETFSDNIIEIDLPSFLDLDSSSTIEENELLNPSILSALSLANELRGEEVLNELNLKNVKLYNLRQGEFKHRAPFSDFKESLFSEVVPFSLCGIFLLMLLFLDFSNPSKEISLIESESKNILRIEAPELDLSSGKPLDILSNEIINLEDQIGGLTSMSSMSPFDWLFKLSKGISPDIPVVFESLSITSSGIIFRGNVPNYPTSGKLDSMLKALVTNNPTLLCKGEVSSEQGSSAQKISITGVLELCQ